MIPRLRPFVGILLIIGGSAVYAAAYYRLLDEVELWIGIWEGPLILDGICWIAAFLIGAGLLFLIARFAGGVSNAPPMDREFRAKLGACDVRPYLPLGSRFSGIPAFGLMASAGLFVVFSIWVMLSGWMDDWNRSYGFHLHLSVGGASRPETPLKDMLIVYISHERPSYDLKLSVNGRVVTSDDLPQNLRREFSARADGQVFVTGDVDLPYGAVIGVIDKIQEAYPTQVVLFTAKIEPLGEEVARAEGRKPRHAKGK